MQVSDAQLLGCCRICVGLENGVSGKTTCNHEKILTVGLRGYIEVCTTACGFGRFDRYMWPFYKKDVIDEKNITREEALEMLECLYLKTCEGYEVRDSLRTAEHNGNLEISGFLTDWIVMKIADFRFVTNTLLTCY